MFLIFLNLSIFLNSGVSNSFEESITIDIHENVNLNTLREDFVFIESVLFFQRLEMIIDCLELDNDLQDEKNNIKIAKEFFSKEEDDSKRLNIFVKMDFSQKYKLFITEKTETYVNISSVSKLIPQPYEKNTDIQHLIVINNKLMELLEQNSLTFSKMLFEIKKMIVNELKDSKWNKIKFCRIFSNEKHIKPIIMDICECKTCYEKKFEKPQNSGFIDKNEIKDILSMRKKSRYEDFFTKKNDESIVKYQVYFFRDHKNKIYLKEEDKKLFDQSPIYNSVNENSIYEMVQNFYSVTNFNITNNNSGIDINHPPLVRSIIGDYILLFLSKEILNLMLFMRLPFGFWQPIKNNKNQNHEFLDESYEILPESKYFERFNIYRKKNKEEYKYIAVETRTKIKKCLEWENGVIIEFNVEIEENVAIGEYSFLASCVKVSKNVKIGKKCTIFSFSTIGENANIGDFMTVARNKSIN